MAYRQTAVRQTIADGHLRQSADARSTAPRVPRRTSTFRLFSHMARITPWSRRVLAAIGDCEPRLNRRAVFIPLGEVRRHRVDPDNHWVETGHAIRRGLLTNRSLEVGSRESRQVAAAQPLHSLRRKRTHACRRLPAMPLLRPIRTPWPADGLFSRLSAGTEPAACSRAARGPRPGDSSAA